MVTMLYVSAAHWNDHQNKGPVMRASVALLLLAPFAGTHAQCWQSYSVDGFHTVALTNDGRVASWGRNEEGQLGDGTNVQKNVATVSITTNDWVAIASGRHLTLGQKADGSIWGWGLNFYGQLGINNNQDQNLPVQIGTDKDWRWVFGGSNQCFGIRTNGTLWSWGDNTEGELGDGTNVGKPYPVQIGTDADWTHVATGMHHELALKANGTLWGWGFGSTGALGDGTGQDYNAPVQIGTATWRSIATGMSHSIGIRTDGTLWGTGMSSGVPGGLPLAFAPIGTDTDWQLVSAGGDSNFAIKHNGTLWAWGYTLGGFLSMPVQVGTDTDWECVNGGSGHAMARKTDGTLWVWGVNGQGQLGDGTYQDRLLPQIVPCDLVTAVPSMVDEQFRIWTDGTGEWLYLATPSASQNPNFRILDHLGRRVVEGLYTGRPIQIGQLATGAYVVHMADHAGDLRARFVKQ